MKKYEKYVAEEELPNVWILFGSMTMIKIERVFSKKHKSEEEEDDDEEKSNRWDDKRLREIYLL